MAGAGSGAVEMELKAEENGLNSGGKKTQASWQSMRATKAKMKAGVV